MPTASRWSGSAGRKGPPGNRGLKHVGDIELPAHQGDGACDHAAIHHRRNLLYVAHTANDAVDVIDTQAGRYGRSIGGLKGVAGALVDEGQDLIFTSNR